MVPNCTKRALYGATIGEGMRVGPGPGCTMDEECALTAPAGGRPPDRSSAADGSCMQSSLEKHDGAATFAEGVGTRTAVLVRGTDVPGIAAAATSDAGWPTGCPATGADEHMGAVGATCTADDGVD